MEKYTNELIHETSPYLLQHAHNPVDWLPFTNESFEKAVRENKLVLISVGYSACHWCHVMEHECFEDEEVAALMNQFFISIKVDREERPDVDQVYMTAVQLMTQKGGWPLNCFTLPDGRPLYGGTYFPKDQWMHVLRSLQHTFTNDRKKAEEYATNLHEGVQASELIAKPTKIETFQEEKLHELVLRWSRNFDAIEGGESRAPKFPLPSNYLFLLEYAITYENHKILQHVERSLDKIAMGGIYDQIGGGFSRYAVDMLWKVPHFEKMLYDNAQLIELYARAFQHFQKPIYKRIVFQTIEWLQREMTTIEGAFYSAIDADSEGEEGKFYCWKKEELKEILGDDYKWVEDFYGIDKRGYWEKENYLLLRTTNDQEFAQKMQWSQAGLEVKIAEINQKLLIEREKRIRPATDIKCLTAWNAMTIKGLCAAYAAFGDVTFLQLAEKNARWIIESQQSEEGYLYRNFTNGKATIPGFLEDYAHVIDAFIELYQVTFHAEWLERATALNQFTQQHFLAPESGMFYFTGADTTLIARKMELTDNVIPASNSVMAHNLFRLSQLYYTKNDSEQAMQMLTNMYDGMEMHGSDYSNWARLLLHYVNDYYMLAIVGQDVTSAQQQILKEYLPNVILAGGNDTTLPALSDKQMTNETVQYVCYQGTCLLPTTDTKETLRLVKNTTT